MRIGFLSRSVSDEKPRVMLMHGLRLDPFQVSGGISTLHSRASGLRSSTQGIPSGPKGLLRATNKHITTTTTTTNNDNDNDINDKSWRPGRRGPPALREHQPARAHFGGHAEPGRGARDRTMYVYVCVYIYIYIYTCMNTYTYMHAHMYTCMCVHVYMYMYIYIYIYIHTYTHIHIYTYYVWDLGRTALQSFIWKCVHACR